MSEEITGASGSSDVSSGSTESKKDSVAYQTYAKTLGEVKSLKARLQEFESKEQESLQAKLAEEGKYKELLESKNKRLLELEKSLNDTKKSFTRKVFTEQAKSVAVQLGAIPEATDDLIRSIDWEGVEISDDFTVNQDHLKEKLTRAQESKSFFFQKKVSGPKDMSFTNKKDDTKESKDFKDMNSKELLTALKNLK